MSTFKGFFVVAALSAMLRLFFDVGIDILFMSVLMSLFCYGKMIMAFYFKQGHGMPSKEKKFNVRGFKVVELVLFFFLFSLIFTMLAGTLADDSLGKITTANLQYLAWSMFIGSAFSFVVWHFSLYDEMFFGSEYEARMEFKDKGYSQEVTEEKILKLRECGLIKS